MKISLVSLGTTGAGPVYSLEMAKALASSKRCNLQIIISKGVTNLEKWKNAFSNNANVDFHIIETYKHTIPDVIKTLFFDTKKKQNLIDLLQRFKADVLYIPFGLMWANYVYKRIQKQMRIVITLHDPHPHDSILGSFKWFGFRMLTDRGNEKYVDDIVILNRKDVDYVKQKTGKNVTVIPHASFRYYVNNETADKSIKNRIGFLGRIEPYKGLDLLIDAFEKQTNKQLKLIIAGSGSIEESLRKRILNNPKIELINRYIEDEEFQSIIDRIDFIVLPYKRASQSGVIPMAFAFGKTVIATKVGALDEQVPDGTGILVDPEVSAIVAAIDRLYCNSDQITKLGAAACRYAQTELTWEHSAKLLLDYLEK